MTHTKIFFDKEAEFLTFYLLNHLVLIVDGLLKYRNCLDLESFEKQYLELECRRIISELEWADDYMVKMCPSKEHENRHRLWHNIFFTPRGELDVGSDRFYARLTNGWVRYRKQLLPTNLSFPEFMLRHEAIDVKDAEFACIHELLQNMNKFLSCHNGIRFFDDTGELELNGVKKHFVDRTTLQFVVLCTLFSSKNYRVTVNEMNSKLDDTFDERDDDSFRDPRKSKTLYNARDKINSKFKTKFKDEMAEQFDLVVLANGFCGLSEMVKVKK